MFHFQREVCYEPFGNISMFFVNYSPPVQSGPQNCKKLQLDLQESRVRLFYGYHQILLIEKSEQNSYRQVCLNMQMYIIDRGTIIWSICAVQGSR